MSENLIKLETAVCPRCKSSQFRQIHTTPDFLHGIPGSFSVAECSQCSLEYQNPRPAPESLEKIYPTEYGPHQKAPGTSGSQEPGILRRIIRAINPLRAHHYKIGLNPKLVEGGKLIELGCASGSRLIRLREAGWKNIYGIELSQNAATKAAGHGFDVRCGLIEEELEKFPDLYFDVIISSMVIEHLYDPFALLDLVAKKLKPGGQFLFSTIIRDSLDAKIYGKYWACYELPRHMVFFTQDDLCQSLKGNFEDIKVIRQTAYTDFHRGSLWRLRNGQATLMDQVLGRIPPGIITETIGIILAALGGSSRVSIECRKRH